MYRTPRLTHLRAAFLVIAGLLLRGPLSAAEAPAYETKPDHPFFQKFAPRKAPAPAGCS
ncbi:MAG: hypothetical protein M5U12_01225 [Verrucomicrobia bacterium]|nr:hypothetical protein [Verrucomicrobiota bacterium]